MSIVEATPIACTLTSGEHKERVSWIAALNRDALRSHRRRDLVLELYYAPEARARIREMVRNEEGCCEFLTFDLRETEDEIRLVIAAPEAAREAADSLFELFLARAAAPSCPCASSMSATKVASQEPPGSKAAGVTAVTLSTGAIACGVCCVLPFALPAAVLASTGPVLAWLVGIHKWIIVVAILAVVGAWGWVAWQPRRTEKRPAASTLAMMTLSTALLTVAVLWPLIEKTLIRMLRA
jgi:hypothetical protein